MKIAALQMLRFIKKKTGLTAAVFFCATILLCGCQPQELADTVSAVVENSSEMKTEPEPAPQETSQPETTEPEVTERKTTEPETPPEEITLSGQQKALLDAPAGTVLDPDDVEAIGEDRFFTSSEISDALFERMYGKSFKEDCTVSRQDLRYIRCLHKNAEGDILIGEMVVNYRIEEDIVEIFHELYKASFPIEKMHLVDDYDASDDWSMEENNTSCFNYRLIAGTDTISNHAYGLAIDINPYYNVYYIPSADYVSPASAYQYKNRDVDFAYKVGPGDLCYELFTEHGFDWGGWWDYAKDYQHFEKPLSSFSE